MTPLAALLFDLDGTLIDTAGANYRAYAAALLEVGRVVDRDEFDRVAIGHRWTQFLPVLLPDGTAAGHAAVAARKQALYPAHVGTSQANIALIGLARASALRSALVTNASRRGAGAVLAAHGLTGLFDVIVTGDDVPHPKPAPDAYLRAMALLGVGAAECLAFEDSEPGITSARRAGVHVVRVTL